MKFGVILEFALGMKKQELFEMYNESYNILCKGRKIYSNLTEEEYFDIMENLSIEFYQTGSPCPEELETEIIGE